MVKYIKFCFATTKCVLVNFSTKIRFTPMQCPSITEMVNLYKSCLWETLILLTCADISTKTKKIREREKKKKYIMCHVSSVLFHLSFVTCHVSRVMCHMSCVTCHLSPVTCHLSPVNSHLTPDHHSMQLQVLCKYQYVRLYQDSLCHCKVRTKWNFKSSSQILLIKFFFLELLKIYSPSDFF